MAELVPNTLIHRDQGGAVETFEAGSTLNIKSGAIFNVDDIDIMTTLEAVADMTAAGTAMVSAADAAAQLLLLTAATAAEIESRCDDSAMEETISGAGALSATKAASKLALSGAGAVTLAAPTKPGMQKIIKMTANNGDVTLALTNCVGQTSGTTATFNDVGDSLVLMSDVASGGKWIVLKEIGVTLS